LRTALLFAGLTTLAMHTLPAFAGKAHVHGEGKLDVVIDKGALTINLELPLDVAVGFERAPKTDKEKADLAAAEKLLADATLFLPTPAAQCTAQPVILNMPKFDGKGTEGHADIDATYSFRCAAPATLKHIETGIFKHFKRLYRLEARRAGPDGQGAMRLSPKQPAMHW
jgi:hypothetical protein